ncbi:hypothetical protein Ciccas_004987 [Cichlidogyrus casuarinus]|uniref:Uncharacterized protein n=1 Tax=Cichlidogyrus casuarinus TaxID=1844966 RepID=A0ABD2Q9Y2_9PLAT
MIAYESPEVLETGQGITLSGKNHAYFTQLLQSELIREKNRLAAKPLAAKLAQDSLLVKNRPFFLPVKEALQGLRPETDDPEKVGSTWFDENSDVEERLENRKKRELAKSQSAMFPEHNEAQKVIKRILQLVAEEKAITDSCKFYVHFTIFKGVQLASMLKNMPASQLEIFIQTLAPDNSIVNAVIDFSDPTVRSPTSETLSLQEKRDKIIEAMQEKDMPDLCDQILYGFMLFIRNR